MQSCYTPLSDAQWQIMKKSLEDGRSRQYDLRLILDCILEVLRTGTQWRNLKCTSFSWQLVYYYFRKWQKDGTVERLSNSLNQLERKRQGKKETPSLVCIDSQSIKTTAFIHQDKGIDGNKKIKGRKRHLLVDTLGLVWGVVIHKADQQDGSQAHLLVEHALGYLQRMQKVLVDGAYQKQFYDWVYDNIVGLEVEVSSKPATQKGFVPIKWRWVVERTFGWTNFFRRLSKDYEKTIDSSKSWILWMNCQIIINRLK